MVDFSGGWNTFWGAISGELGGVTTLLTVIGMLMVLGSVLGYIWMKRRNANVKDGLSGVFIVMFVGAVLAAPGALIPLVLTIVDWAANAVLALLQRLAGS